MNISDGMGSYLQVEREGTRVQFHADVGLIPLAIQYTAFLLLGYLWYRRRK